MEDRFRRRGRDRVSALTDLKTHSDSGAPRPLQLAAARILAEFGAEGWPPEVRQSISEYGRRLRTLSVGLSKHGWTVPEPKGTLYLWQRVPKGDGAKFADRLLEDHRILVTPGGAFGRGGRRYVRWSATSPIEDIETALGRLGRN